MSTTPIPTHMYTDSPQVFYFATAALYRVATVYSVPNKRVTMAHCAVEFPAFSWLDRLPVVISGQIYEKSKAFTSEAGRLMKWPPLAARNLVDRLVGGKHHENT